MKAGVYGRFPFKYFYRKAEKVNLETDLIIEPMQQDIHIEAMNQIDRTIIHHARESIHKWIKTTRDGFVYKRNEEIVGYGYVGSSSGPFAVLDDNDFPAVLAHAERRMAEQEKEFGAEAPLMNTKAIEYFIERKYQIDSFSAIFMSNVPSGNAFQGFLPI